MNDFLKVLLNIRSLRAAFRDLPVELLQEARDKFDAVIEERLAATEAERAAKAEYEKKVSEFRELMIQEGISPDDLLNDQKGKAAHAPRQKRAPRPPKYRYMAGGMEHTWTGQGRMPSTMALAIEAGHKELADFLIPNEG